MISRAWWIAALLCSPAWAQEPAPAPAAAPAAAAPAFDFSSAAVKQIVRDTAATQSAQVRMVDEAPIERSALQHIDFSPPIKTKAPVPKRSTPARASPPSAGSQILSAILETAIDELLFDGRGDFSATESSDRWIRCEGRDHIDAPLGLWETCPEQPGHRVVPIGSPGT